MAIIDTTPQRQQRLSLVPLLALLARTSYAFSSPPVVPLRGQWTAIRALARSTTTTSTARRSSSVSRRRRPLWTLHDSDSKDGTWESIKTTLSVKGLDIVTQPVQDLLDHTSSGWVLSYADLSPDTPRTTIGQTFLATNLAYAAAGMALTVMGDPAFGVLTDVTALASFYYHYNQLEAQGQAKAPTVRTALLIDYVMACTSIGVALYYTVTSVVLPMNGLIAAGLGLVCLGACWIWEEGKPYMILHGLWHLFSAASGYLVGMNHLQQS